MATFTLACAGTLGDHLPYIALGQGLRQRGHVVRLACRSAMHELARGAGLEVIACGDDWDDRDARRRAHEWDEWRRDDAGLSAEGPVEAARARLERELPRTYDDLARACEGADLLVAGMQRMLYGALLARNTGLPWVAASVTPAHQCAAFGPHRIREQPALMRPFFPVLEGFCRAQGLSPIDWLSYERTQPRALLGASAHFAQPSPAQSNFEATGFWFYRDPKQPTWRPPQALRDFVDRHPRPLYLSFSSVPLRDPSALLNCHARAAALLGRGLVVQRGAAGFDAHLLAPEIDRQQVHFVDFMPPDWLLARVGAVLHHGGVGTLARALLHGRPMLVQPLGNDQFFNAQRVLQLHVGAAASPHWDDAAGLAALIADKVLDETTASHAQRLGGALRAEQGVDEAARRLEQWLP